MKNFVLCLTFSILIFTAACDVQSGITKKSVEKYVPTPTPLPSATVAEEPIDPADIVTVDIAEPGPTISINTPEEAKRVECREFNRVMVNGHNKEVNITGACSRLTINGVNNKITMTAASEIVINGSENKVGHTKFVNGKRPAVTDNGSGNSVSVL